jgi:hypothetical protein
VRVYNDKRKENHMTKPMQERDEIDGRVDDFVRLAEEKKVDIAAEEEQRERVIMP